MPYKIVMDKFMRLAAMGQATESQIAEHMRTWSEGGYSESAAEFLGMTEVEYYLWSQSPEILPRLIEAHREVLYSHDPAKEDRAWAKAEVLTLIDARIRHVHAEMSGANSPWSAECVRRQVALCDLRKKIE